VTRAIHSMAKFFAEKMPKADWEGWHIPYADTVKLSLNRHKLLHIYVWLHASN
jgi:hypothetical protein